MWPYTEMEMAWLMARGTPSRWFEGRWGDHPSWW
jgi:hypothetical protein